MRSDNRYQPPTPEQRTIIREVRKLTERGGLYRVDARARMKNARQ